MCAFSHRFKGQRADISAELTALGKDVGWIVRSAAGEQGIEQLLAEARMLRSRLAELQAQQDHGKPRLLYTEHPIEEILRDHAHDNPRSIFIDDEHHHARIHTWLRREQPRLLPALKLHSDDAPLFDVYKVESEIHKAAAARVWLPSGGSLVFHQTEAMVTIDVNSGKNIKSRAGKSAALRTNLEAATEIVRQLRVRNLAGLIVIDFINASEKGWGQNSGSSMRGALASDPLTPDYLPINRLVWPT